MKEFKKHDLETWNEEEEDRLELLAITKLRGKGAPKKKREKDRKAVNPSSMVEILIKCYSQEGQEKVMWWNQSVFDISRYPRFYIQLYTNICKNLRQCFRAVAASCAMLSMKAAALCHESSNSCLVSVGACLYVRYKCPCRKNRCTSSQWRFSWIVRCAQSNTQSFNLHSGPLHQ